MNYDEKSCGGIACTPQSEAMPSIAISTADILNETEMALSSLSRIIDPKMADSCAEKRSTPECFEESMYDLRTRSKRVLELTIALLRKFQ